MRTLTCPSTCPGWPLQTRKSRYCKQPPRTGSVYCGCHLVSDAATDRKRIPCPADPSHSIYEDRLKKHMKKCNAYKRARTQEAQPYFVRGINAGDPKAAGAGATGPEAQRAHDAAAASASAAASLAFQAMVREANAAARLHKRGLTLAWCVPVRGRCESAGTASASSVHHPRRHHP